MNANKHHNNGISLLKIYAYPWMTVYFAYKNLHIFTEKLFFLVINYSSCSKIKLNVLLVYRHGALSHSSQA